MRLRNWGRFFQRQHAWGLGESGRTVNRTRDAVLTDQSPAVLVKRTGFGDTSKHRVGLGVPSRQQLTRMGIGSESAGALKGSVLYQSPAVLVENGNRHGTLWLRRIVRALRLT